MAREVVEVSFSATLVDASEEAGAMHDRSGSEQLEHWARVGKAVSEQILGPNSRVELAISGELGPEELGEVERLVYNSEFEA